MNREDLMQQVANRDERAVTNHSVGEREKARAKIAAQIAEFEANGGKIERKKNLADRPVWSYNTTYGINAK
jgi:regulator of protease activity HflC (stomatin/prohibitin superfamily)